MAHRLPSEIWEEIMHAILSVDDYPAILERYYVKGTMRFDSSPDPPRMNSSGNFQYGYQQRRPKKCVKNLRRTCRGFYDLVNRMPQLWRATLWIEIKQGTCNTIPHAIAKMESLGIPGESGRCDLDLWLRFRIRPANYEPEKVQALLDLMARCGDRLRQLSVFTNSVEFVDHWAEFEPQFPKMARLRNFNINAPTKGLGSALKCPVLQNLKVRVHRSTTDISPLPHFTKSLMVSVSALIIWGTFALNMKEFAEWIDGLLEASPSLRHFVLKTYRPRIDDHPDPIRAITAPRRLTHVCLEGVWEFIEEAMLCLLAESIIYLQLNCHPRIEGEWGSKYAIQTSQITKMWLHVTWCQLFEIFKQVSFPLLETLHANVANPSRFLPRFGTIRFPRLQVLHIDDREETCDSFCISSMLAWTDAPLLTMLRLSYEVKTEPRTKTESQVVFPSLQAIQIRIRCNAKLPIDQLFFIFGDWELPSIRSVNVYADDGYQNTMPAWKQAMGNIDRWSSNLGELSLMPTPSSKLVAVIVASLPALIKLAIQVKESFDIIEALSTPIADDYGRITSSSPLPILRHLVFDLDCACGQVQSEGGKTQNLGSKKHAETIHELLLSRQAAGAPNLEKLVIINWETEQGDLSEIRELVEHVEIIPVPCWDQGMSLRPFDRMHCC